MITDDPEVRRVAASIAALELVGPRPEPKRPAFVKRKNAKWRAKTKQLGGRDTNVTLSPAANARLAELKHEVPGRSQSRLVCDAIETYTPLTDEELEAVRVIVNAWGTNGIPETISVALRWMAQQTLRGTATKIDL